MTMMNLKAHLFGDHSDIIFLLLKSQFEYIVLGSGRHSREWCLPWSMIMVSSLIEYQSSLPWEHE